MTREEKLYSMRMQDLVNVANKLGIKINTKAAKSIAIEKILVAESEKEVAEVMQQKKDLGIECPPIESFEVVNEQHLVPMPGADKLTELKNEVCGDGTPYAEVGKEIAEQAKHKAAAAVKPNRKRGALIEYNGKAQNICAWAKELGKSANTLYSRIYILGWDVEKAFTK